MFGDLDWPLNASREFVSINWASCVEELADDADSKYFWPLSETRLAAYTNYYLHTDQASIRYENWDTLSLYPPSVQHTLAQLLIYLKRL